MHRFGLVLVAFASACGGGAPAPKSPDAPASTEVPASQTTVKPQSDFAQPGYPQQAPGQAPPPPSPAMTPIAPLEGAHQREAALRGARSEVERAQRELESGMGECSAACRALGSMERATGHLCALAAESEDRRRCEDAKTLVQRARDRVRAACGTCPNGPSIERSAPIPSQR